ncbi:MAG: hypothetical protein C4518_06940 [Desulfobacteraceae bacterium]|nr:MAG: hypothetical protein C4518_06940 [Desulfobacteraceae bacterium]
MKRIKLLLLSCLLSLFFSHAWGFSSHHILITRTFNTLETAVGNPLFVTVNFTNNETVEIRGFFFTEQIPSGLSVKTESVTINGKSISDYIVEAGSEGDVNTKYIPYRWILESPPLFEENNPINSSGSLEIIYTVSSSRADSFRFDQFNWAGYYQKLPDDDEKAAFGHSEITDKQTITFAQSSLVAVDDEYTINEGKTLTLPAPGIMINDTGSDGNTLNAVLDTDVKSGNLILNSDGSFTYSHNGSDTNADHFAYHTTNGSSYSDTAIVTIHINLVADPPIANDDSIETKENTPVTINVCGNDTDADGTVEPSSVTITNKPAFGEVEIHEDGMVTYIPNNGFTGKDAFAYKLKDYSGLSSNEATVTVSVTKDSGNNETGGGGGGCFIYNIK